MLQYSHEIVVKMSNEDLQLEAAGDKNRTLRHIIIEASDSRSGVVNPVHFLEVENEWVSFNE